MSTVGMRALGLTHGPSVSEAAVAAAAAWLHDEYCDGETGTCGRWRAGADPASPHARHREYYRDQAEQVLKAAAQAAAAHMGGGEN